MNKNDKILIFNMIKIAVIFIAFKDFHCRYFIKHYQFKNISI